MILIIPPNTKERLPGIADLLRRAWEIYKKRSGTLISIMLISGIVASLLGAVFIGTFFLSFFTVTKISGAIMKIFGAIACLISSLTIITGILAINFAVVDENLTIRNAFTKSLGNLFSGIWLIFLLGFIITGGVLLFIIPGLLFFVWFVFALIIFASSEKEKWWVKNWTDRGMDALLKSKEYVRGYWLDIFIRLFVIWIIIGVIIVIPIIGILLSFFLVPFAVIYNYLIYRDLMNLKGDVYYRSSAWEKTKWIGAGALGYIIAPAIVSLFI
jgi:hypothetical protein